MFPHIEILPLRPDAPPLVLPDRPDHHDCPEGDTRPLRPDAPISAEQLIWDVHGHGQNLLAEDPGWPYLANARIGTWSSLVCLS